jgi:hypothetical protein
MIRSLDPLDWVLFGGPSGPAGGRKAATQIKTLRSIVPHPNRRAHMHLTENNLVLIELQASTLYTHELQSSTHSNHRVTSK